MTRPAGKLWTALAGALAALAVAGPALAAPPVWVVKDKTAELVLFGSVHVLPPGLDWEPLALKQAVAHADEVWFELPIDPATEADTAHQATTLGVLPPDQSLFKLLPPEDAQRLSRVAQAYDASPMLLDRLKPWLAEIALAGAAYRKAGAETGLGVEQALSAEAPPTAQRHAFETPNEQLAIFADTPMAEQLASLHETLKELEDDPDEYAQLIHAWISGDVTGLDHEALEPLRKASPDLFRRVVTERNDRWVEALQARLKGRGHIVVVVGVGHLVGPGGLPARFRALGYSVQGP
ncbi:TraB/GumN family protein [Phenylobacterium sp.]|uniref:TraB/GumN family protein n=1 Tax=Phenylobacterium sp. TaxID=1871053 RepID=UPI002DF59A40|nr:TraB/GumN family protein [Phenylobacterium sp.]